MNIPVNHQAIMPYLILDHAEKFEDFVALVFRATFTEKVLAEHGKIKHCEANIAGSTIMFTNTINEWKAATANLFVYVANADETYHHALANGASSIMGLSDQPYGRTCGVEDPCGNVWWITSVG